MSWPRGCTPSSSATWSAPAGSPTTRGNAARSARSCSNPSRAFSRRSCSRDAARYRPSFTGGGGRRSAVAVLLLVVLAVGAALDALPPLRVVNIPFDRRLKRLRPRAAGRRPAQLALDLARVDGVAAVVAQAVGHRLDHLRALAHDRQDHVRQLEVRALVVAADVVDLSGLPLL